MRYKVNEVYAPLKRKESNRFQIPLILYIPFVAFYLIYGSRPYDAPVVGAFFPSPIPPTVDWSLFLTPSVTPTIEVTNTPLYVIAPTYSYPTQTPAFQSNGIPSGFPFITDKGDFYTRVNRVLFSYYYPDLGGVNCHEDNWVNGQCKDVTASKVVGWREYLGKGIAIHSDMYSQIPYGSQIYVVSPPQIAGIYTVVDLCCGCKNQNGYYFDFLFTSMPQGLGWSYNVDFVVTRYGWDVQLIDVPAPNCGQYISNPTQTLTQQIIQQSTQTPLPTYTHFPTYTPFVIDTSTPTLFPTETVMP